LLAASAAESGKGEYTEHSLNISYLEIYNEKVKDLLEPKETDLAIRANAQGEILIPGLATVEITSIEQFDELFDNALKHRSVGVRAPHLSLIPFLNTRGLRYSPCTTGCLVQFILLVQSAGRSCVVLASGGSVWWFCLVLANVPQQQ
jgi:hypothetical protein